MTGFSAALTRDARAVGLVLGPLALGATFVIPPPEGMTPAAWHVAGIAALMATWWVTAPIPIPVTALMPMVLFPLLTIMPIRESTAPYADPVIFLFMGGFILGIAMQRWNLHARIGLSVLAKVGTSPKRLLAGMLISTAFVSMWVSNTSTAIMMLPVAISILALYDEHAKTDEISRRNLGIILVLAVAYASNIGGLGTLIGTPTNALLRGYMEREHGVQIGFAQWMVLGVPLVIVMLIACWLILMRLFPVAAGTGTDATHVVTDQLRRLGRISAAEKRVAVVFAITAIAWITRPAFAALVPQVDDTVIAIAAAIALFFVPSGMAEGGRLLTWDDVKALPWGVLLLFGGGLSLAAAIGSSGLDDYVGASLGALENWPVFFVVAATSLMMIFLTELTSNTASAAAFLPLGGAVALGLGFDPLLITIPLTLAASCGFMMPVGTPPNAIAYASGRVTMGQMIRAGIWLNLVGIALILVVSYAIVGWLFVG
jgi:sodium-dependent dicarboxylate transporter 2/3/5